MPCFHPLKAWHSKFINPTGKRSMVFSRSSADQPDSPIDLPCGQCIGCRLERSRQWAVRISHEAQLYEDNCFITLTYDPMCLPDDNSLNVKHYQDFMKRLRFRFKGTTPVLNEDGIEEFPIRFFHCGEYGETNGRPHYHACIFNFDFPDKVLWKESNGNRLYISKSLSELWPFGFCTIGSLTFESAAYVARYIVKKVTGDAATDHYMRVDPATGEITFLKPEYTTMSRRPGIGHGWFDKFSTDVFPHDYIVVNGVKQRPPRYYDGLLETTRPYEFDVIKDRRSLDASTSDHYVDNHDANRLKVREQVQLAQFKLLPRNEV
jgi:hypothetical protein